MEPLTDLSADQLRHAVLSFAADLAQKVIHACKAGDLSSGFREDTVEVAGVTWEVTAFYFAAGDMVRLVGQPKRDPENPPHPFMQIFNLSEQSEDDGSFQLFCPSAWLPKALDEDIAPLIDDDDGGNQDGRT